MDILRIADTPNSRTGGMSRAMYGVGDVLATQGHSIDYLFAEDLPTSGTARRRRLTLPYLVPGFIKSILSSGKRYDVVELHEPLAAPYCFQRPVSKNLPPVVIYSHGLEERNIEAEKRYHHRKGIPLSAKERYSPVVLNRLWQSRYAVRHCDHFIGCNSEDIEYLKKAGVPASRLSRLDNGVEAELLAAGQVSYKAARSGILFLGSWIIRKGTLDVVPTVSRAMRRHPTLRFTVAGCGCPIETVLTMFDDDLRARIHVLPNITDNQTLIGLYRKNSIFLLPSYFEGLPLALLEAAALGMAIVTTNVCGMADFIQDGVNGFAAPVGDADAIAERLETLICDPTLARRLGGAARQTAQSHTWENGAKQMADAYRAAIASHVPWE